MRAGILACIIATAAAAAGRPWYLNELSNDLIKTAVAVRRPNIPEAEASSIAKRIVDGGMSPPQVTQLAGSAAGLIENEGTRIQPSQYMQLVKMADGAYGQVRASQGFDNYLKYVSVNAQKFDTKQLTENMKSKKGGGVLDSLIQQQLSKLEANAEGRAVIDATKQLVDKILKDAGVDLHF